MKKINAFHAHEALHTVHLLQIMLAEHVVDSLFVETHSESKKKADIALSALMDLYQTIGTEGDYLYEKE